MSDDNAKIPVLFPGELLSSPEILGALCTLAALVLLFIALMAVGVADCTDAGIICTAAKQDKGKIFFSPSNTNRGKNYWKKIKCN